MVGVGVWGRRRRHPADPKIGARGTEWGADPTSGADGPTGGGGAAPAGGGEGAVGAVRRPGGAAGCYLAAMPRSPQGGAQGAPRVTPRGKPEGGPLLFGSLREWLHAAGLVLLVALAAAVPILSVQAFYQPVDLRGLVLVTAVGVCYGCAYLLVLGLLLPRLLRARPWGRAGTALLSLAALVAAVALGGGLAEVLTAVLDGETAQHWWVGSGILLVVRLVDLEVASLRRRARQGELREAEARHRAARAELAALRARVDPHFLFNSLNAVAGLVEEDPPRAARVVDRLADLYHHTLRAGRQAAVPLAEELDAVDAYLAVQELRFEGRFLARVEVPEELRSSLVPPLCLQPLVENAILHGTGDASPAGPPARLRVFAEADGDHLHLGVEDDGPGPGASSHRGTGTSLAELGRRVQLATGGEGRLVTGAGAAGRGFRAVLELPREWR